MVYGSNGSTAVAEDYLANTRIQRVTPSYESIDNMAYYVIESSEEDFNNIMMNTGIKELQYFESTGSEYIYEGSKLEDFKKTITDGFKSMWEKVKGMIDQAIKFLQEKSDKFHSDIWNKIDQKLIKQRLDNIKPDKVYAKSYTFIGIDDKVEKYFKSLDGEYENCKKDYETALAAYKSDGSSAAAIDDLETKINKHINDAAKAVSGRVSSSISTIVKNVKEELRGKGRDWKGSEIRQSYDEMLKEVLEFPGAKRSLKKQYDGLKKKFNDTIKDINKACDAKKFEPSIFNKALKGMRTLRNMSISVEQASISVLNERYNLYRSIILKLIGTKKVKESATLESSTIDTVDSLFAW